MAVLLPATRLHLQLVVHEATIISGNTREANEKMHSTPAMAGAFAASVRAKRLLLTHFSRVFGNSTETCCIQTLGMREVRQRLLDSFSRQPATALRRLNTWLLVSDFVVKHSAGLLETKRMQLPRCAVAASGWRSKIGRGGQENQGLPMTTTIEENIASLLRLCGDPAIGPKSVSQAVDWDAADAAGSTASAASTAAALRYHHDERGFDERHGSHGNLQDDSDAAHAVPQAAASRDSDGFSDPEKDSPVEPVPLLSEFCYPPVKDHWMCEQLAQAARATFGRHEVLCARDLMTVVIPATSRPALTAAAGPSRLAHKSPKQPRRNDKTALQQQQPKAQGQLHGSAAAATASLGLPVAR